MRAIRMALISAAIGVFACQALSVINVDTPNMRFAESGGDTFCGGRNTGVCVYPDG